MAQSSQVFFPAALTAFGASMSAHVCIARPVATFAQRATAFLVANWCPWLPAPLWMQNINGAASVPYAILLHVSEVFLRLLGSPGELFRLFQSQLVTRQQGTPCVVIQDTANTMRSHNIRLIMLPKLQLSASLLRSAIKSRTVSPSFGFRIKNA